jgi:hypothetical protein
MPSFKIYSGFFLFIFLNQGQSIVRKIRKGLTFCIIQAVINEAVAVIRMILCISTQVSEQGA